jgi:hypothetical protein
MHQTVNKHIVHSTSKLKNGQLYGAEFLFFALKSAEETKNPVLSPKIKWRNSKKNDAAGGLRSHDLQMSHAERVIAFTLIMSLAP